jgi:hypothetical protein
MARGIVHRNELKSLPRAKEWENANETPSAETLFVS